MERWQQEQHFKERETLTAAQILKTVKELWLQIHQFLKIISIEQFKKIARMREDNLFKLLSITTISMSYKRNQSSQVSLSRVQ